MTPNTVVTAGARLDYKPVHLRPLSNEVKTIPPKERVY
jgi:succinate dehydrogenase / fumarate reductase, flavoprotein subunit